jgi:hypothetical protein
MKVNCMCIFIDSVLVIDILYVTLNKSVGKKSTQYSVWLLDCGLNGEDSGQGMGEVILVPSHIKPALVYPV